MATYTPLGPVSSALYGVFQDAALQALVPNGGVHTDVPENPAFPFLWFEVREVRQHGGFGTKPGVKALPEMDIRLHVFSLAEGLAEADAILARAIALIADPPTVTGYGSWAIFHDSTIPVPDQLLNGVKVHELVSQHRLYVEEA